MKNAHLLAHALSTPWALMPERMAAYAAVLASHYAGELPPAKPKAEAEAATPRRAASPGPGGIAVIPVFGAIVEWSSDIDICDGGTSTRAVAQQLSDAANDPSVSQILMVFNSPGGSVYGVSELGDQINQIKASKPVVGVAQSLAASAAYWLMSQCTEAYCTPGGEVGSIGVYSGYQNVSKAMEMAGLDVKLFSAGKFKTEMSPFTGEGLSEEAEAFQVKRAQDYYGDFTKAVAKGRGVGVSQVRDGMGQGRVLGADQALAENMIDGVMTMDQVMAKMQKSAKSAAKTGANRLAIAQRELAMLT